MSQIKAQASPGNVYSSSSMESMMSCILRWPQIYNSTYYPFAVVSKLHGSPSLAPKTFCIHHLEILGIHIATLRIHIYKTEQVGLLCP